MDEIEKNGFNLNISRYVSTAVEDAKINLEEVNERLITITKEADIALETHNKFLAELGLSLLPTSSKKDK